MTTQFVICVKHEGCPAALERRKIYRAIPDEAAAELSMTRVVDESGEDYLYPADFFLPIVLPESVEKALLSIG